MNYVVVWSDFAKEDYANILTFLQSKFGQDSALRFLDKTEKIVEQIEVFPNAFPASDKNGRYRKAVINKNTSLVYKISNNEVELLYFWDNRMKDIV